MTVQAADTIQQFKNSVLLNLQTMIFQRDWVFDDLITNAKIIDLGNHQIRAFS